MLMKRSSCLHYLKKVAKPDFASICLARMRCCWTANVHVIFKQDAAHHGAFAPATCIVRTS